MFRLGEAAHPGPWPDTPAEGLVIGCMNPTGLVGKSHLVAELPTGSSTIYAVSESHLSAQGKRKCETELKFHKVGMSLHAGAPVPTRSSTVSAVGGKHRGVAFLSSVPGRQMTPTWTMQEWKQNRFHIASFAVGRRWIQGAVIYGHAAAPDNVATKEATDQICRIATTRLIEQSSGLRFIAGDFNQSHLNLPSMQYWQNQGWVNAQWWAQERLGKPLQPTCKGVTIKDHIYLSPELAMYLEDVIVDQTIFKDHAVLAVALASLGSPPKVPMWKQPLPIDWTKIPELPEEPECSTLQGSSEAQYASIMKEFEDVIDHTLKANNRPPLLPRQRGRAKTLEVHWVSEYTKPPSKGREGELQPKFHGIDPLHAKKLRQVRRVHNLLKLRSRQTPNPQQLEHASCLWDSIRKSSGFPPHFVAWWNHEHGHEAALTDGMPSMPTLRIICAQLEEDLANLEKVLTRTRVAMAKRRRVDDPNVIFKDLQKEPPKPCQTLLKPCHAIITAVDEQESAVLVDPPQTWDPSVDLFTPDSKLQVIHAEPDKIWVEDANDEMIGQTVKQDQYMGQLNALFDAFGTEWSRRWDKHLNVPADTWDPIVDFVREAFPMQPEMQSQPITYEVWRRALKKKSKRAAVGPDGVSRMDLLRLPKSLTIQLLEIFAQVEAGHPWPAQLLEGFIIALEKVEGACSVQQYRPICIFSVAYRTWSSIRAKEVIHHLSKLAPSACAGSLPHKSAADIWYTILAEIELAHHTQEELSGAVLDLIKCFNMIPRFPVMAMMEHFGVATGTLRAWASAQTQMKRRFKLRSCVGPALGSTTGFPEGCALSVTSMIAVNITAHRWLQCKYPRSTLFSYVDNLELLSPQASEALQSLHALVNFTEVLDVEIDFKKTYVWSTQTTGRKHLRTQQDESQSFTIMHWARDLGGHMSYTRQHTNRTLQMRLEQMPKLWNLLARSLAPYPQKLRALKAKAWPLALHGAPAVTLADNHFSTLRTGATRGLKEHTSGMNPMVHLSAVEHPTHDPQFYVLLSTVLTFRSHGPDEYVLDYVMASNAMPTQFKQTPPGPCHVLLVRLHQLSWSWVTRGVFLDHDQMPIDVLHCPVQELRQRLIEAWQIRTMGIAQDRKTFGGAAHMHAGLSTAKMQSHPPEAQAVLRAALNGTFFTADRLAKRDPEASSKCRFCGAEDNQVHRHWRCPHFAACRRHMTQQQIEHILAMPPVIPNHGWIPTPPSLLPFREACLHIPDETKVFAWPDVLEDELHFFTDGSCLDPTSQLSKLASWGVVLGSTTSDAFVPISNGLLRGWTQTAARAEIVAATSACECAIILKRPCFLWVDNDRVYKKLRNFKHGKCQIGLNQKDADLWGKLADAVARLGSLLVAVTKVVSHQNPLGAQDEAESWIFRGNAAADALAASAYSRFPMVTRKWSQLRTDVAAVCLFRESVHKVIITVAQRSVTQPKEPEVAEHADRPRIHPDQVQEFRPEPQTQALQSKRFAINQQDTITQWFSSIIDPGAPIKMLSWFQLNILFEYQTGLAGIKYKPSSKRYFLIEDDAKGDFVKRTNNFSRWTQGIYGPHCKVLHLRPFSATIRFWTMCVPMRISEAAIETCESLLGQHQRTYLKVKDLQHI